MADHRWELEPLTNLAAFYTPQTTLFVNTDNWNVHMEPRSQPLELSLPDYRQLIASLQFWTDEVTRRLPPPEDFPHFDIKAEYEDTRETASGATKKIKTSSLKLEFSYKGYEAMFEVSFSEPDEITLLREDAADLLWPAWIDLLQYAQRFVAVIDRDEETF